MPLMLPSGPKMEGCLIRRSSSCRNGENGTWFLRRGEARLLKRLFCTGGRAVNFAEAEKPSRKSGTSTMSASASANRLLAVKLNTTRTVDRFARIPAHQPFLAPSFSKEPPPPPLKLKIPPDNQLFTLDSMFQRGYDKHGTPSYQGYRGIHRNLLEQCKYFTMWLVEPPPMMHVCRVFLPVVQPLLAPLKTRETRAA